MRFFVFSLFAFVGVVSARKVYEPIAAESASRPAYYKPAVAAYQAAASANAAQISAMFRHDHGPWSGSDMSASSSEEIMDAFDGSYAMNSMEMLSDPGYGGGFDGGYGHGYGGGDMHSYGGMQHGVLKGKEIIMAPKHKPITLHYRTHAQPIIVHQTRIPGPKPEVKHTMSHEEPHRVVHEVVRPIIQEVHEIIQPYRRVVQQVQPVVEHIETVVAKEAGHGGSSGGGHGMSHSDSSSGMSSSGSSASGVTGSSMSVELGGEYAAGSTVNKHFYRRALPAAPIMTAQSQMYEQKIERPKTFINKRGVPVYQSNYGGSASGMQY